MKKILIIAFCFISSLFSASRDEELIRSAKDDNFAQVEKLLKAGANPNGARLSIVIDRAKKKFDFTDYDGPVYARPWDPPYIKTRIKGMVLDATCLFFALDNDNFEMVTLLIQYNADMNALITFEGQEIIEDTEIPDQAKVSIITHNKTEPAGKLHLFLKKLLGLNWAWGV